MVKTATVSATPSTNKMDLSMFFSMEAIFCCYLLSGILKIYLTVLRIDLPDITLLLGGALCIIVLREIVLARCWQLKKPLVVAGSLFLFMILLAMFSMLYTLSSGFYLQKFMIFMTCVVAFFFPVFYKNFDIVRFVKVTVFAGVVLSGFFVYFFPKLLLREIEADLDGLAIYLMIGYLSGLCLVLVAAYYHVFGRSYWLLAAFFVFVLLSTGARGPLIFSVGLSIFLFFSSWLDKRKKVSHAKIFFQFSLLFLLGMFFLTRSDFIAQSMGDLQGMFERSFNRLEMLVSSDQGASIEGRKQNIDLAVGGIFSSVSSFLFGYGFGSYGMFSLGVDELHHPHNIFLEMWFETGVVGFAVLFAFMLYCFYICWRQGRNDYVLVMMYLLLNALKSSSVVQLRVLFGFFAVFIVSALCDSRKKH